MTENFTVPHQASAQLLLHRAARARLHRHAAPHGPALHGPALHHLHRRALLLFIVALVPGPEPTEALVLTGPIVVMAVLVATSGAMPPCGVVLEAILVGAHLDLEV